MQFEKSYYFLIVTNTVMCFLALAMLVLTCIKRRDICSGIPLLIIFTAFLCQAIYYGE